MSHQFAILRHVVRMLQGGLQADGSYIGGDKAKGALLASFGVSYLGTKIPREAHGTYTTTVVVEGVTETVTFTLLPAKDMPLARQHSFVRRRTPDGMSRVKSSSHRLFVTCPCCAKIVPAGRLNQHGTIHAKSAVDCRDVKGGV